MEPPPLLQNLGVSMTFEGPASESDVQDQVEMLNVALAKAPAAIALAALDTNSVIDQLIEARNRKIPVIGFDSGVPEAPEGSIYANASTDNYNAAGVAAEKMFEVIGDKIKGQAPPIPLNCSHEPGCLRRIPAEPRTRIPGPDGGTRCVQGRNGKKRYQGYGKPRLHRL